MTALFTRQLGPERAFERLYKAHVQDVYRYALMVLRNREDAEDVVQTTFMKAYRAFARGERPRSARPWLITIAHNTCKTRVRDAMRRPREVAFDEGLAESVETQPRHGVEAKELLGALGALSFNQRSALVMRELEGRSYSEIASVLEVSPSAVETLLFRARRAVREQLEGALTCGEAERSLSLDLDGRLTKQGKAHLRAHLRTCDECASLARRQRARRAALRGLGPLPVPGSIASWGGGTAAGTGIAAKVAAVVAAGAAAVGVGYEAADAVSEPLRQSGSAQAATGAVPFAQFAAFPAAGPSSAAVASTSSRHRLLHDPQFQPLGASVFGAPLGATPAQQQSPSQSSPLTSAVANPVSALGGVVDAVRSTPSALPAVRVPSPPPLPVQLPPAPALPVPQLPPAPQLPPPPAAGLPPLPPLPVEPPAQLPPTPPLPVDPGLP